MRSITLYLDEEVVSKIDEKSDFYHSRSQVANALLRKAVGLGEK